MPATFTPSAFVVAIGLRFVKQPYPQISPDMVSVRQAGGLPRASFRFRLTVDTLAIGYILPTTGRIRDFHPLERAPAGRT